MSTQRYCKTCRACLCEYEATRSDQIFCSRKCQDKKYHRDKRSDVCAYCSTPFVTSRKVRKFCSRECTSLARVPSQQKEYRIKREYGLDSEQHAAMVISQGGLCMICKDAPLEGKPLHIDHDHITGKVRSLLCMKCNNGLGLFQDSPEILFVAYEYLKKHKEN